MAEDGIKMTPYQFKQNLQFVKHIPKFLQTIIHDQTPAPLTETEILTKKLKYEGRHDDEMPQIVNLAGEYYEVTSEETQSLKNSLEDTFKGEDTLRSLDSEAGQRPRATEAKKLPVPLEVKIREEAKEAASNPIKQKTTTNIIIGGKLKYKKAKVTDPSSSVFTDDKTKVVNSNLLSFQDDL